MYSLGDIFVTVYSAGTGFSLGLLLLCYQHSLPLAALLKGSLAVSYTQTDTMSLFIIPPINSFSSFSLYVLFSFPPYVSAIFPVYAFILLSLPPLSHPVSLSLCLSLRVSLCARQQQQGVCLWKRQTDCVNCQRPTHLLFMHVKYRGAVCDAGAHTHAHTHASKGANTRIRTDMEIHF